MMQNVYPVIRILDYAQAKAYYVDGLGFQVDWAAQEDEEDEPVFLQLTRDGLSLYLTQNPGDGAPGGSVYLYVPDVDAWCADAKRRGVEVWEPPQNQPWGSREARFRDPFGNRLTVATRGAVLAPKSSGHAAGEGGRLDENLK